jgi:putative transposase
VTKLSALIKRVFATFKGEYGAPRIFRSLCQQHGYTGGKYKATTDSAHSLPLAPKLLAQDFGDAHASAPNEVWLSDITYLWTR